MRWNIVISDKMNRPISRTDNVGTFAVVWFLLFGDKGPNRTAIYRVKADG